MSVNFNYFYVVESLFQKIDIDIFMYKKIQRWG